MTVYNAIYQLIRNNDCVIIPNFGAFIANYCDAKIDFSNQEFSPPKREILFDETLKNNDNLLVKYLSDIKNISIENANIFVEKFVEEIKAQLENGEKLQFNSFGELLKQDDKLEFKAYPETDIYEEVYGFNSFNFPYLTNDSKTVQTPQNYIKEKKKKKKKYKWLFIPAAVVLFGAIIFFVFYSNYFIEYKDFFSNLITKEIFKSNSKTNEIKIEEKTIDVETVIDENINSDENLTINENIKNEIQQQEIIEEKYIAYTIVGGFREYKNAEKLVEELKKDGFSPNILPLHKGLYRVAIKGYCKKEDAINDLENLQNQANNKDLWILFTK